MRRSTWGCVLDCAAVLWRATSYKCESATGRVYNSSEDLGNTADTAARHTLVFKYIDILQYEDTRTGKQVSSVCAIAFYSKLRRVQYIQVQSPRTRNECVHLYTSLIILMITFNNSKVLQSIIYRYFTRV